MSQKTFGKHIVETDLLIPSYPSLNLLGTDADGKIQESTLIVPGTTTGQLAFWNGSSWTYTETTELFWDDTNKRLGIGTDSPDYKTHIVGELRVQSANYAGMMLLGADAGVTTVSTNVNKQARIAGVTYGNSYTMGMFSYESDSSKDEMIVGSKAGNTAVAPNQLSFYTSTTKGSTGSSIRRMHFYSDATIFDDGMLINRGTGNLGFGTTSPQYRIDVQGITPSTSTISAQGGINIETVDNPSTNPTLTLTTGGSVDAGAHYYHVTYTTSIGETGVSSAVGITTDVTNNAVQLTDIPISSDPRVTGRKIYRSKAGATSDTGYLLTTLNDNTTIEYLDIVADSTLTGSIFDGGYRPNTTSNFFTIDDIRIMLADKNATVFGQDAAHTLGGSGGFTTAFGYRSLYSVAGFANSAFGHTAGYYNTSGKDNSYFGYGVGSRGTNSSYNVGFGNYALYYNAGGYGNVALGHNALRCTSGYSISYNIGIGMSSGRSLLTGTYNSFLGYNCGYHVSQKTDARYSTALGAYGWTDADYQMAYGDTNVTQHLFRAGTVNMPNAIIGDGGTTDYAEIKSDGEINLHGTARVYKNEWINVQGLKAPGTKPATLVDWGVSCAWEFSDGTDDTICSSIRLPQDMDRTVAPEFKIGFASDTNSGDVVWQIEYIYLSPNEDTTASAQETLTTTTTISATADGLTIATITGMDLPSSTDQIIKMRIKRLGADANDTLGDDCVLVGAGLKYVSDKLGVAL